MSTLTETRASDIAGWGLFATADLPAGTPIGADLATVNHSCDPNLGWSDGALVTLVDVPAGAEVVVDYAMHETDPTYLLRCHCPSQRCRQMVEGTDWRLPQLQRRYEGHFAPAVAALITKSQS